MKLTQQTTETFIRRMAAAPQHELEDTKKLLASIATDTGQAGDVALVARRMASIIRALLLARG